MDIHMSKKELTEKENLHLVLEGRTPQWVPSFMDACSFVSSVAIGRKKDPKTGLMVDVFGTEFTSTIDGPMVNHTKQGGFRLKDITKWKEIMPDIDLSAIDWEEDANIVRNKLTKPGQAINYTGAWLWEQMHYMMGFENALASLVEEPEASFELLNALADFYIEAHKYACKYLKPDMIMVQDHVATHKGLLISPKTFRELIKPVEKRVVDAILEIGAYPEIHVDGNIEAIIGDYAEIGFKVIQPFQVFNDINRAKVKYSMTAIGGWDAFGPGNQEDSTEEEIRASVRLAIDTYAPGGRYVFWESGATDAFPETVRIIRDEARIYGHQYYNK